MNENIILSMNEIEEIKQLAQEHIGEVYAEFFPEHDTPIITSGLIRAITDAAIKLGFLQYPIETNDE